MRRNRCLFAVICTGCRGRPGFRCQHLATPPRIILAPAAYMPDTAADPASPQGSTMPPQSTPPPAPLKYTATFSSRQTRHDMDHGTFASGSLRRADNSVSPASRPECAPDTSRHSVSDETPGAVWQRPDGFGPRFHTKVDAAAKSCKSP